MSLMHYEEEELCCETKLPETMSVSASGTMATCWACGYRCGYWECACELEHDCEEA